jgi:hypothetical protein
MTPTHLHTVSTTLLALPAAMALTHKLLQNHRAHVPILVGSPGDRVKHLAHRANTLTKTLKNIVGYHHHGLND